MDAALGENTAEIIPPVKPDILGEAFLLDQFANLIEAERERLLRAAWSFAPERVHRTLFNLHLDFADREVLESLDRPPDEKNSEAWLWWGRVRVYLMAREVTAEDRLETHWQALRSDRRVPGDAGAQLAFVEGAASAASHYGRQQRWQEVASARDELRAVAGRFPNNIAIQEDYAKGLFNGIAGQQRGGTLPSSAKAHEELRRLAKEFPQSLKIQELSTRAGIYMSELLNAHVQVKIAQSHPVRPSTER